MEKFVPGKTRQRAGTSGGNPTELEPDSSVEVPRASQGRNPARLAATSVTYLDAIELLEQIQTDLTSLRDSIASLESRRCASSPSVAFVRDARHAARPTSLAVGELNALHISLEAVHHIVSDPRLHKLIVADAPLALYLQSLCVWMFAVLHALEHNAPPRIETAEESSPSSSTAAAFRAKPRDELLAHVARSLDTLDDTAALGDFGTSPPALGTLRLALEELRTRTESLTVQVRERFG